MHQRTGSTGMRNHYHKIFMHVKGQSARTVIYKKLNTGEGHQSVVYHGEHAQNYKDSLCLLVGSVIKWF